MVSFEDVKTWYFGQVKKVEDKVVTTLYGADAMSDTADANKIAFTRDAVRLVITVVIVVVVACIAYFVGEKTGINSWIRNKLGMS
jgi:hypothetical protein